MNTGIKRFGLAFLIITEYIVLGFAGVFLRSRRSRASVDSMLWRKFNAE